MWDGDFISNNIGEISERELDNFIKLTIGFLNSFKQNPQEKIIVFKNFLQEASFDGLPFIGRRICNCCLERKSMNRDPLSSPPLYFRLFIDTLFRSITVCRTCKNELTNISLSQNSESSRSTSSEVTTTDNDDSCIICMDATKDHALVPCGHKGFCLDCATKMAEECKFCPICRKSIESILKVHNV